MTGITVEALGAEDGYGGVESTPGTLGDGGVGGQVLRSCRSRRARPWISASAAKAATGRMAPIRPAGKGVIRITY